MEHPWLARYLANECSDAEAAEIRRWLAASPENRRLFEQFQQLWQATPTEPKWDVEAALANVEATLRDRPALALVEPMSPPVPEPAPYRARRWVIATRWAAVLALIAGGVAATGVLLSRPKRAIDLELKQALGAGPAIRTATTPRGQRAALHLPDGTSVILGPESTLRYPENFGTEARDVALTGEAYFEVQHDARRPFTVRAGKMVATDLGTAFMVTAYPSEADSRVVVRAGRVGLRAAAASADAVRVLEAGDLGRLDPHGKPLVEPADTSNQFAWTRGELVLTGTPLREAAAQLSRWYDVDVQLASPEIGARRLEASFEDEPVADVFRLIAASLRLQVEQVGRTYTFRAQ